MALVRNEIHAMEDDSMLLKSSCLSVDCPTELQPLHSDTMPTARTSMTEDVARPGTIHFILSCSICQSTLSTIYEEHENNDGLHRGIGNPDGQITKLWLTECAHLTCAKHLEGGGIFTITLRSASLLMQPKAFPSMRKTSLRKLHAHCVSAATKISRPRYSMRLEERPRVNMTTTYLQSTSKSLRSNSVTRAMKHCGYARSARWLVARL